MERNARVPDLYIKCTMESYHIYWCVLHINPHLLMWFQINKWSDWSELVMHNYYYYISIMHNVYVAALDISSL